MTLPAGRLDRLAERFPAASANDPRAKERRWVEDRMTTEDNTYLLVVAVLQAGHA